MTNNAHGRRNATRATTTPAAPDRQRQVEEELVQAVLASFQDTQDPRLKELIQALASAGHGAGAHSPPTGEPRASLCQAVPSRARWYGEAVHDARKRSPS